MSPLTEREKGVLLGLAQSSIQDLFFARPAPKLTEIPERLYQRAGCFVTLRKAGTLRGCVGRIHNTVPLVQAVCDCAIGAACADPRFSPLQADEFPAVRIDVSVLSPLAEITPEAIEIGRHGLLVSQGPMRGLLLPQVAVEWKWDRVRFLQETCFKAGLPRDAWLWGARIEAFTAEVFGEVAHDALRHPKYEKNSSPPALSVHTNGWESF
ncbi:MAG: AmmeMemoRadiSam system protein A [Terriglobia bacterium]